MKNYVDEKFLIDNKFIKKLGVFGEFFYHEKYSLLRCWFNGRELEVGKEDPIKHETMWIATVDNKEDFKTLFRIMTKSELIAENR